MIVSSATARAARAREWGNPMHIQDLINIGQSELDKCADAPMRHLAIRHESAKCPRGYADELCCLFVVVGCVRRCQLWPTVDVRGSVGATLAPRRPPVSVTCAIRSRSLERPVMTSTDNVIRIVIDPVPPGTRSGTPRVHKAETDGRMVPACGSGDGTTKPYGYKQTNADVTCPYCKTDYPREAHREAWAQGPI